VRKLNPIKKPLPLLIVVGLISLPLPSTFGQTGAASASSSEAGPADLANKIPAFAVVSVRPNKLNDGRWRVRFTSDGFSARGMTLGQLLREAYGIFEDDRITGAPKWVNSERYDIEAKVDDADVSRLENLGRDQRLRMVQALLADRFKLKAHREFQDRPIYALVVAKKGPRLQESKHEEENRGKMKGMGGVVTRSRPGQLTVEWDTMAGFAQLLTQQLDRKVVDKTGLTGRYDLKLDWTPEDRAAPIGSGPNGTTGVPDSSSPSIFTAVQEQLGLKLEPQTGPVEILVIDSVEMPSAN
jgi:uncharacterized protein (TIGR03435 family)